MRVGSSPTDGTKTNNVKLKKRKDKKMKETLFCQVVCDYPDYENEFGQTVDGTKCYDCETFNDLFEVLQKVLKENVLDHVHLDFCHKELTNKSHGSIVLPLKNKNVYWYQNIVRERERLG